MNDLVSVFIRIRPLLSHEQGQEEEQEQYFQYGNQVFQVNYSMDRYKIFSFDYVFDEFTTQEQIQQHVLLQTIDDLFQGYAQSRNILVFCYGQTGAGKTYTLGTLDQIELGVSHGLIPFTLQQLEGYLKQRLLDKIRISFYQLYLDQVFDLLSSKTKPLAIREVNGQIFIENLIEADTKDIIELTELINLALYNRIQAETLLNKTSSRSHCVLNLELFHNSDQSFAKLSFADLAGSERVIKSQAKGQQLAEAKFINSSLSTLATVINSLSNQNSDKTKKQFIGYRDAKLTRLLQPMLQTAHKTILISNISLSKKSINETISTLQFSARCKQVQSFDQINQFQQKLKNNQQVHKNGIYTNPSNESEVIENLQNQIFDLQEKVKSLEKEKSLNQQSNDRLYQSSTFSSLKRLDSSYQSFNSQNLDQLFHHSNIELINFMMKLLAKIYSQGKSILDKFKIKIKNQSQMDSDQFQKLLQEIDASQLPSELITQIYSKYGLKIFEQLSQIENYIEQLHDFNAFERNNLADQKGDYSSENYE